MYPATERFPPPIETPITLPQSSSGRSSSFPLKTLIGAVVAAALVVFGAWIAGFMGAMIGLVAGGGLIGAGYLITNTNRDPDIDSICRGEPLLADDSILWIMGTESAHLANILALCRKERSTDPQAAAACFSEKFITELGYLPSLERAARPRKKSPDLATKPLLEAMKTFDLKKELKQVYILPGETLPVENSTLCAYLDQYLNNFAKSLTPIAQRLSTQQKQDLLTHFQTKLLPIFASTTTLFAHLTRFPQFNAKMQTDSDLTDLDMNDYAKNLLEGIAFLTNQSIIFNELEKDLLNHSCPLIFASTTVGGQEIPDLNELAEIMQLDTPLDALHLGIDLQTIYTTAPNIGRIQAAVESFGVEVRDLKHLTKQGTQEL